MIHDATGKFSSRWVFPDRSSLALVINRTGYIGLAWRHAPMLQAHATDREPHIGEYAAKTNAIWGDQPVRPAPAVAPDRPGTTVDRCEGGLLAVVFQDLVAGRCDLRAILLQACQDREVALIDHRAAKALHVTRASLLLLGRAAALLLGKGIR
jgi:hypothetical protein